MASNQKADALNEVVVIGYGTRKKKDMTGSVTETLEGKVSGVQITTASPYPKNGKEKFDQYIEDNANPVFDSSGEKNYREYFTFIYLKQKGQTHTY